MNKLEAVKKLGEFARLHSEAAQSHIEYEYWSGYISGIFDLAKELENE